MIGVCKRVIELDVLDAELVRGWRSSPTSFRGGYAGALGVLWDFVTSGY